MWKYGKAMKSEPGKVISSLHLLSASICFTTSTLFPLLSQKDQQVKKMKKLKIQISAGHHPELLSMMTMTKCMTIDYKDHNALTNS